jgi:hypothetical protein
MFFIGYVFESQGSVSSGGSAFDFFSSWIVLIAEF